MAPAPTPSRHSVKQVFNTAAYKAIRLPTKCKN